MNKITLFLMLILSACVISAVEPFDLQSEIDNAPNGGTVLIPCGVYDIGDVVIASNDVWQKVVTIQGCGHGHLGQSPALGSTQWDYLIERGHYYGTVLRGTISVQKGSYSGATTAKAYFRDFALIGHGSGVGIDYGDGVNMFPEGGIENVSIGNYDIGIRLRRAYYLDIHDVSMAGVGIGLQNIDSNVITTSGLNVTTCTIGLDVTGNSNTYIGGSVQACDTGVILGGFSQTLEGYYFEQTTSALHVTGRDGNVSGNYFAGNSGDVLITGINNKITMSEIVGQVVIEGGYYNRLWLSSYKQCTYLPPAYPTLNKCEAMP